MPSVDIDIDYFLWKYSKYEIKELIKIYKLKIKEHGKSTNN